MPKMLASLPCSYGGILLALSFLSNAVTAQISATSTISGTVSTQSVVNAFDWTNPSNIQNADGVYATSSITGSSRSTWFLDAKNWGFQTSNSALANYIPPGATINGIEVFITERKTGTGSIRDNRIILLKAGAEAGTSKASSTLWASSATFVKYGSNIDLWGTTWTVADLTNANFGIRIQAKNQGNKPAQAEIDHVRIIVYFNQVYYYSNSSGNLELTSTWGTNTDGTGTNPGNFTNNGQIFFLRNRTSASLTGNITISGTDSKMVVGDGTNATTLTVPSNYTLTGPVDIAAVSALVINNTTGPTLSTIATNTTVTYGATANQNVQQSTYYNLTLSGSGNKLLQSGSGATSVTNILTIDAGITFDNQGNNVTITGGANGISNSGTATGSGRYIYSTVDVSTSISGTGSATYSNLEVIFSTTGGTRTLTLGNAATITGNLYLTDGTFANGSNLTMANGSNLLITDGVLGTGITSGAYDVTYSTYTAASPKTTGNELAGTVRNLIVQTGGAQVMNLNRDLVLTGALTLTSGTLDATSTNYNITLGGNFVNNATLTPRNNIITFNGSGIQTISTSAGSQSFYDVVVNNGSGGSVQLNSPVSISHALTLTNGLVTTSNTNTLTLASGVTVSGGNTVSYIDGPLSAILAATSGTLTFPVGKSNAYRPVSLTLSQVAATATTYTAELFAGAPPDRTMPAGITHVSSKRYYTVSSANLANLSSATITINYGPDDAVTDAANLRIAKSNGSNWENIGGIGTGAGAGSITSNPFASFSDFALANATGGANALPLTWISFKAVKKTNAISLQWETAQEVNTSRFEIERSQNGTEWKVLGTVRTNNNAYSAYEYTDETPLTTANFYRIKLIDADGSTNYSKVVTVFFDQVGKGITVAPNPVTGASFTCIIGDAYLLQQSQVQVYIVDLNGRTVATFNRAPLAEMDIPCRLPAGEYVLNVRAGSHVVRSKLIVQQR